MDKEGVLFVVHFKKKNFELKRLVKVLYGFLISKCWSDIYTYIIRVSNDFLTLWIEISQEQYLCFAAKGGLIF